MVVTVPRSCFYADTITIKGLVAQSRGNLDGASLGTDRVDVEERLAF